MIRQAEKNDFDFIYNLYMHPHNNPWLLYEIMGKEEFKPIFDDLQGRGQLYIYQEEGRNLGMFKLQPMKFRNSHIIYLGGIALDQQAKGKGVGSRMMVEILQHVKAAGFTRIELTVATINQKAISLYEKSGFKNEGLLRNYTYLKSEGRYIDEYVMGYLF